MNKKLGALALVGASAVVLAGCAGGSGGAPERGGDRRPDGVARRRRHARRPPATTSRRRSRRRTTAGPSPSRRRPGPTSSDTYTAALSSNDSPDVVEVGNTQALGFADAGLFLDISDIQEDLGGDDLLSGSRGCRHLRRLVLRRPVLRRWPHRLLHAADRRRHAAHDARRVRRAGHRAEDRHRLGHLRAGQGLVQRASLRLGARRRDRRPGRRRVGRAVLQRREPRGSRAAAGGLPERVGRPGRRQRAPRQHRLLRRRGRLPVEPGLGRGQHHRCLAVGRRSRRRRGLRGLPRHVRFGPGRVRTPRSEGRRDRPDLRGWLEHRRGDQERQRPTRRRPR